MDEIVTEKFYYEKKAGTSAIGGQLYETKLLSLVLFRALQGEGINEFYLGSNIKTGDFDDVCIKWKRGGKDTVVFLQLKHKENKNKSADFNLVTYFESYKELQKSFSIDNEDILFKSDVANTDFYLVFYTVSNNIIPEKYNNKDCCPLPWLEKLICAGREKGNIFQISDIDFLMKLKADMVIDLLGEALAENLVRNNEHNYASMLTPEYCSGLFKRYHVVLAEKVINVSSNVEEKNSNKFRIGSFRKEFLSGTVNDDIVLARLRKVLFTKLDKEESENVKSGTFTFKLPHCFGNIDLTVRNYKRICALAKLIKGLFKTFSETKVISLDMDSCNKNGLNEGFLALNGGLESLVGNLLISDDKTQMLKFNDNLEPRHINAKKLFVELNNNANEDLDLFSYRFDIQLNDFTSLSLLGDRYERQLAKEYLNKLWCYTDQAKENEVEDTLTREIETKSNKEKQLPNPTIQSVGIFLKFHDAVQKWWMQLNRVEYLDRTCKFYEQSITEIVDTLATINDVYVRKIMNSSIKFDHDDKIDISFDKTNRIIVINTKNRFLTAMKIYQRVNRSSTDQIFFLDIEYVENKKCYDIMLNELKKSKYNMIVIINKNNDQFYLEKTIETILEAKASESKNIIVVTETRVLDKGINYPTSVRKYDENMKLIDIQKYIEILKKCETTTVQAAKSVETATVKAAKSVETATVKAAKSVETSANRLVDNGSKQLQKLKIRKRF